MASMRDIANAANVSVSTVSSVMTGRKYVSPLLQARVERAAKQLGYDYAGAGFTGAPLMEVGLILPGIYSSYFQPLLSGFADAARNADCEIFLCDSDRRWDEEQRCLDRLIRRGVKNIIIDSVCDGEREEAYYKEKLLPLARERDVLICLLSRESRFDEISSYCIDHFGAAYAATEHLLQKGRRHIVHICGDPTFSHSAQRIQGYRMALLDNNIAFDERYLLEGQFTPISGFAAMQDFLNKEIVVDAVFSANDQMAVGAMKAIQNKGIRIPEDIAVVGFDDLNVSSLVSPSLTTVHYPIYQMGYSAMTELIDIRGGRATPRHTHMNAKLIVRRSSDASQVDDWELNKW